MARKLKEEIIYLDKRHLKIAEQFANERCGEPNTLYKIRGGFKRTDIITGALGEMGVYKFAKYNCGLAVSKPDFTIHDVKSKSYAADLSTGCGKFYHVKAQNLASQQAYGASWLMQRKDRILNDPEPFHYIVPTLVDIENLSVTVYGAMPVDKIVEYGLIGLPYFDVSSTYSNQSENNFAYSS